MTELRPRSGRSGGSKYLPPPARAKAKAKGQSRPERETCPKCDRVLEPGKYHDCGEQPSLFAELN